MMGGRIEVKWILPAKRRSWKVELGLRSAMVEHNSRVPLVASSGTLVPGFARPLSRGGKWTDALIACLRMVERLSKYDPIASSGTLVR